MSEAASTASSELNGKSEHYVDTGLDEDEPRISNPGVKLRPNERARFYDDVRGQSEARSLPEEPKEARPLPRTVRRLLAHPSDSNYDGIIEAK
jgi:hypothetical protein